MDTRAAKLFQPRASQAAALAAIHRKKPAAHAGTEKLGLSVMFVSIRQTICLASPHGAGQPLQSRADPNTRIAESGVPSQTREPAGSPGVAPRPSATGGKQTTQSFRQRAIWQKIRPGGIGAAQPRKSRTTGVGLISRGDLL